MNKTCPLFYDGRYEKSISTATVVKSSFTITNKMRRCLYGNDKTISSLL
ncbi:hypothetical protein [Evansella halocellulosilytica]|nr:hypothetical protein [Evansella halocellulosilytica]